MINDILYRLANMTRKCPFFPARINMWNRAGPFFCATEPTLKQNFAYLALKVVQTETLSLKGFISSTAFLFTIQQYYQLEQCYCTSSFRIHFCTTVLINWVLFLLLLKTHPTIPGKSP